MKYLPIILALPIMALMLVVVFSVEVVNKVVNRKRKIGFYPHEILGYDMKHKHNYRHLENGRKVNHDKRDDRILRFYCTQCLKIKEVLYGTLSDPF